MTPPPPSGEQIEIAHGSQRATVVGVGGGLRTYEVAGRAVLDGYGVGEMCSAGRGQVLVPWPNRIADGRYDFDGSTFQLALTEPVAMNAIHGLVRWSPWEVAEREGHRVVMEHRSPPRPGYPFTLDLRIEYALDEGGLRVTTHARNLSPARCPFGAGAHPYLTVGTPNIDEAVVEAPGRIHLRADGRGIPVGEESVAGSPFDLRSPRRLGALRLDDGFRDLERDGDGLAWVHLRAPAGTPAVSLWADRAYDYLMIFTGDTLGDRARQGLAVEPMTCAPNAFRSGDGLIVLEPDASFEGRWGIAPA